jgi:nucleotide-binding universal stress UspA family protein
MLQIRKILVPHDFSDFSEHAMRYALTLASTCDAELHLVFAEVLYGDDAPPPERSKETSFVRALNNLGLSFDAERGVVRHQGNDIRIQHSIIRDVAPAPAIIHYAEDHDIDLIVMSTHGRRGLRRLLLGSVANEVLRTAPCSVLTVRTSDKAETIPGRVDAILVPIDFSKYSRAALQSAKAFAKVAGARLDLLHVIDEELHPAFYTIAAQSIYDIDPQIDEKAVAELQSMDAATQGEGVETRYHVHDGHAARTIIDFAEELDSDLIIMSTHGLRGLEHFFMGSVAEKVVRRASVPVLTVKAFGKTLVSEATTDNDATTIVP